jgi:hypothetical protein|tara:strand:- start:606 stop:854 length:249 start_codon:yes stop_codon:yes gene_type:complete
MNLTKTYTNSDDKITHVEMTLSHTEDEVTTSVSDIFELREPLDSITEIEAIMGVGIWWAQIGALQKALETKLSLASHTEATV